jgi:hypothetical protein
VEATFAEASAIDHVARLVAKEFCGGDQMWKMEQVADSETGTAGCGTGTAGPHAASRILLLLAAPNAVSFDWPLEDWTAAPTLSAAASL